MENWDLTVLIYIFLVTTEDENFHGIISHVLVLLETLVQMHLLTFSCHLKNFEGTGSKSNRKSSYKCKIYYTEWQPPQMSRPYTLKPVISYMVAPWTAAHQAPLSMGFPKQEYWSGLPFSSPRDLPDPGIKPVYSALQGNSLPLSHLGSSNKS